MLHPIGFGSRDTIRPKVRECKKIFHGKGSQKKTEVETLISDRTDFKIKKNYKKEKGHCIMIKGSIQEDIKILNIYAPNIGTPQYIRQTLTDIKLEIDSNTIIAGDCNISLTP